MRHSLKLKVPEFSPRPNQSTLMINVRESVFRITIKTYRLLYEVLAQNY